MDKFAISLNNFKDHILYECILRGSAVAVKDKFKDYYTHNGEPENWKDDFLEDVNTAERVEYRGSVFYTHMFLGEIAFIFYDGHVYSFDRYFTDCEVFREIIKENF